MILLGDWLVVPGVRIGGVPLLRSEQSVLASLGEPSGGEGAAGHHWSTWVGKGGGRFDTYSAMRPNGDRPVVIEARATSPRFRLANGLHVGSPSRTLLARYPAARKARAYTVGKRRVQIWDAVRQGLAWEAAGGRVVALIVHPKGEPLVGLNGTYQKMPVIKD